MPSEKDDDFEPAAADLAEDDEWAESGDEFEGEPQEEEFDEEAVFDEEPDLADVVDEDVVVVEDEEVLPVEDEEEEEDEEALDELEAEELEMLTDDEASETLVADEAAELRAIRRAEIAMDNEDATGAGEGEFVCSSCFLVLKVSQLASPRKKICKDCAA